MAEVERPRRTKFKRVSARPDVFDVEFRTPDDHFLHDLGSKKSESMSLPVKEIEEDPVFDQSDLYSFCDSSSKIPLRQRLKKIEVIDDGKWRSKGSDKILSAKCIDSCLDAYASIVLCKGSGGHPNKANAPVSGCRSETGCIDVITASRMARSVIVRQFPFFIILLFRWLLYLVQLMLGKTGSRQNPWDASTSLGGTAAVLGVSEEAVEVRNSLNHRAVEILTANPM